MKKLFTFLLGVCVCTMVMAQAERPTASIQKAGPVLPVIDGQIDDVWADVAKHNVDRPFTGEAPTLGEEGTSYWKMVYDDAGLYILIVANDDMWNPYPTTGNEYEFDKIELYFDTNAILEDGKGGSAQQGNRQIAPKIDINFPVDGTLNELTVAGGSVNYAYKVTNPAWTSEWFVPWESLPDDDGSLFDQNNTMGFDVNITDNDGEGRRRMLWSNIGPTENWNNMDPAGHITFAKGDAVIMKASTPPEIDGVIDAVWATANTYNIGKSGANGEATIGEPGTSTWKALWSDDGVFLLLTVNDDVFNPSYKTETPDLSWEYDKPEIYFDVNPEKIDGNGPNPNVAEKPAAGHYQWAPAFKAENIDGAPAVENGATYAFKVSDPAYVAEYFFPFTKLLDKDLVEVDRSIPMGFDVTIIDHDADGAERRFGVWKQEGNWNDMDGAGKVVFDGAVEAVLVEKITIAGGSITTDNGTLQMVATVTPANATAQKVTWSVENGTGRANIDANGVLTGLLNGTVTVKGTAKDADKVEGTATVTISGQNVTLSEINYLKNGFFDNTTASGAPVDWSNGTVTDGEVTFGPDAVLANQWDYKLLQVTHIPFNLKDEDFLLSFKAWADEPRTLPLIFEDSFNDGAQWDAYASSGDPGWSDKTWLVDLTTEPTVYTLNLNFSPMQETTVQEFNFQVGLSAVPIHLDSIYLVNKADLALVTSVKSLANSKSKVQLYPNPVQNELTISKIAVPNSRVSVYNAVGQKLMEKTANGTQAKFDVANLRKGMYFVRFSDGSNEKFLKQ